MAFISAQSSSTKILPKSIMSWIKNSIKKTESIYLPEHNKLKVRNNSDYSEETEQLRS